MAAWPASWNGAPMLPSRRPRFALLTVLAALAAAASTAATASAATPRYASPGGSGTTCAAAAPCGFKQAVEGAKGGDEVIVTPGDYTLTEDVVDPATLTIHGVADKPRPRLHFSGPKGDGLWLQNGSNLRYVAIEQPTPGARTLVADLASIDQVIARSAAISNTPTLIAHNSTVTNSIVIATGTGGAAIGSHVYYLGTPSGTLTLRNVTAIATGSGGVGILGSGFGTPTNLLIRTINVIARGGPGGYGLAADAEGSAASITVDASRSNFPNAIGYGQNTKVTPAGSGDNQTAAPAFRDAAAGDYREAAGSPTIDAGADSALNGAKDVDGGARIVGTTDIGADEFVAQPAGGTTPPAGGGTSQTGSTSTPSAFAGVKLGSTRLRFDGRYVRAVLSCPAGTPGGCGGRARLTARRRLAGSAALSTVGVGRARFAIRAGQHKTVRVRVPLTTRRWLRSARRHHGKATLAARNGAGQSRTNVTRVRIIRRR
jgi:hypothetical protein